MRASTTLLLPLGLALAACSGRPPARNTEPEPATLDRGPPPDASTEPPPSPPAEPPTGTEHEPAAWPRDCAGRIEEALAAAARLEPALARGRVERRGGRAGGEQLVVAMFPPIHPVNFHLRVSRSTDATADAPAGEWHRRLEILAGRGFLTCARQSAGGEAWIAFDGWDVRKAESLAAIFEPALDRCLGPDGGVDAGDPPSAR